MWKLYAYKFNNKFPYNLGFVLVDPLQKYLCNYYSLKNLYDEINNFEFDKRLIDTSTDKDSRYSLILEAKSRISLINDYPELFL